MEPDREAQRAYLEGMVRAFYANATRYRRRANAQKDPGERAYWDACATAATKRAEMAQAEIKQMEAGQ
ncbi:MAG: hypothetical protein WCP82_05070 [Alphaproteobacteria bacterium]